MKYIIIGTAGHVDHGKTAIIKALTGTDTDRLKEEKARGISIDLGFASLKLSGEVTAGIVDVPGHERFLKNMLAGTGGIDLAMLVIAADEGVMPQTREHLAMLSLYGVKTGVVVLNKIDKVDEEWLDLVEEDVKGLLVDTFLGGAPVCRVSAVTGAGLDELRRILADLAAKTAARDSDAPFRLWIDRAFTVRGHGAVITGSVLGGAAAIGDGLRLHPADTPVRVRGLEWHGQKVDRIQAGQRAAINLGGADTEALGRGMVLSAPGRGQISDAWDVVADWQTEVASGTRVRLHLGTGEFLGRLYYYKNQPSRYARLLLAEPLAASLGDRGILRLYSPQHLLAGVTLLAPAKNSRRLGEARPALAEGLAREDWPGVIARLIADYGQPMTAEEIIRSAGYVKDAVIGGVLAGLERGGGVIRLGEYYLEAAGLAALTEKLTAVLGAFHRSQPDRPGLGKEILRQRLELKDKAGDVLLDYWLGQGIITVSGAEVALKEFADRHNDWRRELMARAESALADVGLTGVDWPMLAEKLALPPDKAKAALELFVRQGTLVRIGEILVYRGTLQNILKAVRRHLAANPTITVSELRDLLGTSRKVALSLLEYFDLQKYTIREGDSRRAGAKLSAIE